MESTLQDIKQTLVINAPIQKVWDAVSTAEAIGTWFMPNDFQAVVGHEFLIQSPFGPSPCKVLEIDPPNKLSFAWDEDGWFVSFILKEVEGKTEFTLIHGGWKESDYILPKPNMKSSMVRDNMAQGWAGICEKLRKVVEM
ncbi:SRPBCC domain-containing protein [Bacillus sp. RG28]|uniref:SRPBCC domain-containing protein n=1 Tax=Gottfriedia endophytica TaxID=2820819 RepID=A0A940SHR7_9BACI|nr:SRPBCC domain-containing protein [Gottfriedia endophytica]MBP0723781.1 SRPBCC domain-containing protein [Gottfriedia endophytica]